MNNLRLVTKPLCTTCHKRAAEVDGECGPCRDIGILQDCVVQSHEDIQTMLDALERAATDLEQAAQRTHSKGIKSDLTHAASEARCIVVMMWERYQ